MGYFLRFSPWSEGLGWQA